ncbi:MAG: glycosyltransferase involved in cell wall biosynthesis [Rhodothermales bacterium]|jgi:glycosyltransferase involved in cell wall biosynthesis
MRSRLKLSVIIPVYNEVTTIESVLEQVSAVDAVDEILVVDDCSSDGTDEKLAKVTNPKVRLFRHEKNRGKGAAIRTAQEHLTGDAVIIQDADLEYSPSEFPRLLAPIADGRADVVYGSRYSGSELLVDTFWHYVGNKILTTFSNILSNLHLTDMETCYKMMRVSIFKQITVECNCFGFEPEITAKLAKMNCRIFEVPISYNARRFDEGKKIGWRDGVKAIFYIIKFNVFRRKT